MRFFAIFLFMNRTHLGPWRTILNGFTETFVFANIFAKNVTPCSVILRRVKKLKCPKIQNCLTLCRVELCAVRYCAKSTSVQCDTARSPTPCSVSLHRVKQFFFILENFYFHDFWNLCNDISKKIRKYFKNPKMANTALSPTPRSVILHQVRLCAV